NTTQSHSAEMRRPGTHLHIHPREYFPAGNALARCCTNAFHRELAHPPMGRVSVPARLVPHTPTQPRLAAASPPTSHTLPRRSTKPELPDALRGHRHRCPVLRDASSRHPQSASTIQRPTQPVVPRSLDPTGRLQTRTTSQTAPTRSHTSSLPQIERTLDCAPGEYRYRNRSAVSSAPDLHHPRETRRKSLCPLKNLRPRATA